ncbi:carboxymuconolactone decarboxylase [Longimycelium tulufanense]|uniref:Carboxymuconolactone decarboxylase n=1 Tax=Longimycelium tulufanense TaxID=907463 RepID=A0A8J3CE30_9PSEU|nr:peroxidase-related enzyme [Longimycelium tulufanense]GGM52265.1 carboxymuconolactone decarboxylase [Longimycelium tulufanense]
MADDLAGSGEGRDAMPHIDLPTDSPGIIGLFEFRPETARPLLELGEALLRSAKSLSPGERELIGAFVSGHNQCRWCARSHSANAAAQLSGGMSLVNQVHADPESAPISDRLKALLRIAELVRQDGKAVTAEDVAAARAAGASDLDIHDTVLIAAMFSLLNRYVDGLGATAPDEPEFYEQLAGLLTGRGYLAVRERLPA